MTRLARTLTLRGDADAFNVLMMAALAMMMALAAMPEASGQTRLQDDTAVHSPVAGPQAPRQDDYRARVRDEMAEWRAKMQAFDARVGAQSQRHVDAGEKRLRAAWRKTEAEAHKVEIATGRDWARSKTAYETASRRMATAWDKVRL